MNVSESNLCHVIERVETDTGHYYRCPQTGTPINGVTTILKSLPKNALENWKLRKAVDLALKGEKAWKDIPDGCNPVSWLIEAGEREALAAAKIGTGAHNFAEKFILGLEPCLTELNKKERYHVECFLQFVEDFKPDPVLVEKVVTHIDKEGRPLYCGTIDLVAKLSDGYTWLIDYKASSSQARSSHALQAAAYSHATHWLDPETGVLHPMPEIDRAAVVLLNGGSGQCYRAYELDSSSVVFSVFKNLLRIHNFCKIEDRVIVGELVP